MSAVVKRGVAAAVTVVVAAAVNVATGMLTQHWAVAWWAATVVLVVVGAVAQVWLTVAERGASGDGPGDAGSGGSAGVVMRARASGRGRVYQAGRDQTINEKK